ncbi:MAG: DUF72 domain-containing protein [Chloroflexota bacterium]
MTIKVGTCSWTDPTILRSGWYPTTARTAEDRLQFYASRFPLVEVDSSYYALPSERNAVLWAQRTPADFTFDFKAFALMTGHGTQLSKLPPIVRDSLPQLTTEGKQQIYMKDLPEEAQRWVWEAFDQALEPLRLVGKLGAVLLQFPPWFGINRANKTHIARCRAMLPQQRLAVEFRNGSWLHDRNVPETLALLAHNGMTYVVVDEPQGFKSSVPLVPAVTEGGMAILRLHGRNVENWQKKGISVAERFKYLYNSRELDELAPRVFELAEKADQTHVLFNNCYSDYGVRNAAQMIEKLRLDAPDVA